MAPALRALPKIRTAARRLGIRKTARIADVTPMKVSRFVHAAKDPDFATVVAIAHATGFALSVTRPGSVTPPGRSHRRRGSSKRP